MPLRPLSAPPPRTLVLLPLRRCFFPLNINIGRVGPKLVQGSLVLFLSFRETAYENPRSQNLSLSGLTSAPPVNGSEGSSLERKRTDKRVASFGAVSDDERHATAKNR